MADKQGLINVARGEAQTAAARHPWDDDAAERDVKQAQAVSDRLSSPNHRLSVTKTHPSSGGTPAPALSTDAP